MIPCYVCGQNASSGWVQGHPPSPDSQKMALCAEHDTPENREKVFKAWQAMLTLDIEAAIAAVRFKAHAPSVQLLSIRFVAGGMLSFVCLHCEPTEHGTLKVEEPDGKTTFIPMQQIRDYTLQPIVDVKD